MSYWKIISITHNEKEHSQRQMQWQSMPYMHFIDAQEDFIIKIAQYINMKTRKFAGLSPDGKTATFKEDDIIWEIRIITECE